MKALKLLLIWGLLVSCVVTVVASPVSVCLVSVMRTNFSGANAKPISAAKRPENTLVVSSERYFWQFWMYLTSLGGGGGGKGGGGSSGGSSGSKGGSSGGSSGSRGSSGSSSNSGGSTRSGSGTPRGSNGHYGGGATVPYRAGLRSPLGLTPFFILPFVFWMPFYWGPYGAYYYHLNATAPAQPNNTDHNSTDPILCVCQNYQPCGCDNTNGTYDLPPDTKYAVINGTEYAIVNGTLENGTTAPGGTDDASSGGMRMGLFLTKSGTWISWGLFAFAVMIAFQTL